MSSGAWEVVSTARERACETLVARYQPVIRSCVRRYRVPADLADELMQVGYLGLMKTISNFDPQVGSSLAAYARPCISGEIKRYFRDRRWQVRVHRSRQELRLQVREATETLTQQLARAPTASEMAGQLHLSEEQILQAQCASQVFQVISLDAPLRDQDGAASLGDQTGQDDPALEHMINIESLHTHWAGLDDQTQRLLTLRFYGNLTQDEIGQQLGVSQMQVSRLLRRALDYLRTCLTPPAPDQHHWDTPLSWLAAANRACWP